MRLMTSLAAAGDNQTIGDWTREHGIGGVVVVLGAAAILYVILKVIGGGNNRGN